MSATPISPPLPVDSFAAKTCPVSTQTAGPQPRTILFSEGSSTSARQSLYALGRLGHTIDVCDSQRLGLGRFSRYVRRWYVAPSFAADPGGYLDFLRARLAAQRYDVLLPVHDQVFLLSRFRQEFAGLTGLAVPPVEAVRQLQSKIQLAFLLDQLALAQPVYEIVPHCGELQRRWLYPVFVKQEHGTAGRGVWRVESDQAMQSLAERLKAGSAADRPLLVQQPAHGQYRVVQAVFRHGELVAAHDYAGRAPGVGGSAHARVGSDGSAALDALRQLGGHLVWHGALHIEYFHDARRQRVEIIDVNPRIGETMNATLSGVNLCQSLVDVSLDRPHSEGRSAKPSVRTHSLLTSLLGAAERGASRRQLMEELARAARRLGVYADSEDELVRPAEDWRSLLPAAFVVARLLANPRTAERMVQSAIDRCSLDEAGIQRIEMRERGTERLEDAFRTV